MRAGGAPRQLSGRGVSYWTDGKGDDRILYVTTGYRLVALNAKNGQPIAAFGKDGIVDLKVGAVFGRGQQIDLESGEIGLHSTPTVVKDMILVGSSFKEGMTVKTHNNTKGLVRAFDVRTGKMIWKFNTIPKPGEFGDETWENESWAANGNTGVWSQMTVDEEAGLAYLPVETPTSDFYGGHRPGNNLFAESLVAVDLKTGVRKWHFQFIHHGVWDHDMSSAPMLVDITVEGRPVKAVAVPSKQGWLYMFDRITGKPIWPMPETPVPQSDVPGEKTAKTQPIPSKPPAYARTFVRIPDDVIDFTPALRAEGLALLKRYRTDQSPFVPYILGDINGLLGSINIGNTGGGTNWPGAGLDPETKVAYLPASNSGVTAGSLVEGPPGFSDIRYLAGVKGAQFSLREGPGFGSAADAPRAAEASAGAGRGAPDTARAERAGASDREAALRRARGHRHEQGRPDVAGAARRHAGRRAQSPAAQGPDDPEDGPERRGGPGDHAHAGDHGRPAGHLAAGAPARRDAAGLRQEDRRAGGRGVPARAAERLADDLHARRQAVHHRGGERRQLLGRVHRVQPARGREVTRFW